MVRLRRLAFLLLYFALINKVAAEAQICIVKGTNNGYYDGIYDQGQGTTLYYRRMGGPDSRENHVYLYRGTEQVNTWVLGEGTSFDDLYAVYRAPAGGDQLPAQQGWQMVYDGNEDMTNGSRDGRESSHSWTLHDMRVTGFKLKEATAEVMYQRRGEETVDGVICRVRDFPMQQCTMR